MKRHLLTGAALVLAVLCLLVTPRTSEAQRFRSRVYYDGPYYSSYSPWYTTYYYPRYWGYHGMYPYRTYYYYSPWYATRYYSPPTPYSYTTDEPTTGQTYYYTQAGDQEYDAANPNVIYVRLNVPEEARVWFDDQETQQRGTDRLYVSPPVAPGKDYVYHVKAQWMENGRQVTRTKAVTVHAGDWVNIDMTTAPVSTPQETPRYETDEEIPAQEETPARTTPTPP